jgi:hypothetical protein
MRPIRSLGPKTRLRAGDVAQASSSSAGWSVSSAKMAGTAPVAGSDQCGSGGTSPVGTSESARSGTRSSGVSPASEEMGSEIVGGGLVIEDEAGFVGRLGSFSWFPSPALASSAPRIRTPSVGAGAGRSSS